MAEKRDYYEVMGIPKNASDDDIKKAYRKLAKQYHPDLHPGDKVAEEKFKELNEANEVLSDKDKRSRYDQFGHAGVDPNFGAGAGGAYGEGFDPFDIFGSIFGGFGGAGGSRRNNPNAPRRGTDCEASVTITLEEAASGCKKQINYRVINTCAECNGSGAKKGTTPKTCPTCKGRGKVMMQQRIPGFGNIQTERVCEACRGKGKIIETPCQKCGGNGQTQVSKAVEINIPAGIESDRIIKVGGRGNAGQNGGSAGDLLVYVTVQRHSIFERRGDDIYCDLPLTFVQATLGAKVVVPTLDGKVEYDVPAGVQPGDKFKLRGKGVPHINGRGVGDEYVVVNIEIPRNLSKEQKELLQKFEKTCDEKNYQKRNSFFEKLKNKFNK